MWLSLYWSNVLFVLENLTFALTNRPKFTLNTALGYIIYFAIILNMTYKTKKYAIILSEKILRIKKFLKSWNCQKNFEPHLKFRHFLTNIDAIFS